MNNTKQYAISLDIPEGWAPTGEYRAPLAGEHHVSPHYKNNICQAQSAYPPYEARIILKKAFVPKPLEHGKQYRIGGVSLRRFLVTDLNSTFWLNEENWKLALTIRAQTREGEVEEIS